MSNELIGTLPQEIVTDNYESDIKEIIKRSQMAAYQSVNILLLRRNWLIGKRIFDEELKGKRAGYGLEIIKSLSISLSKEFGKGYGIVNLYRFYTFYKMYKNIFLPPAIKLLTWSHYYHLMSVKDPKARAWYENECLTQNWSSKTLRKKIYSQYYYRIIETNTVTKLNNNELSYEENKLEFIKNPVILNFLDIPQNEKLLESDLENAIISNLRDVLLELGKGYCFFKRQYHIHTEKKDYYIDLVFYNYILKCFVLIDLKTSIIEHKDVGQMDMYVRMFDELIKGNDDNPTLGIILCSETDEDIARYSILKGNEQLFATKYKLYLPSEEELKAEIEHQKELYYLSHPSEENK